MNERPMTPEEFKKLDGQMADRVSLDRSPLTCSCGHTTISTVRATIRMSVKAKCSECGEVLEVA